MRKPYEFYNINHRYSSVLIPICIFFTVNKIWITEMIYFPLQQLSFEVKLSYEKVHFFWKKILRMFGLWNFAQKEFIMKSIMKSN